MPGTRPVRLQLSRRKGFNLQDLSRKYNGLDAVKVTRRGRWENPFIVSEHFKPGTKVGGHYIAVPAIEDAVETFREFMAQHPERVEEARRELRGKNLACWCRLPKPGQPDLCHAACLLEIANA